MSEREYDQGIADMSQTPIYLGVRLPDTQNLGQLRPLISAKMHIYGSQVRLYEYGFSFHAHVQQQKYTPVFFSVRHAFCIVLYGKSHTETHVVVLRQSRRGPIRRVFCHICALGNR